MRLWDAHRADLVLLDLGLPDLDGVEVIRRIRREATTPIIILSARGDERDKIGGLEAGADDYLTKPFATDELNARIRAVLRRISLTLSETVGIGLTFIFMGSPLAPECWRDPILGGFGG